MKQENKVEINVVKNEHGLYLTSTFRGCVYGQLYKDATNDVAISKFRNYVRLLDNGKFMEVTQ
jgi:hypothetical protein